MRFNQIKEYIDEQKPNYNNASIDSNPYPGSFNGPVQERSIDIDLDKEETIAESPKPASTKTRSNKNSSNANSLTQSMTPTRRSLLEDEFDIKCISGFEEFPGGQNTNIIFRRKDNTISPLKKNDEWDVAHDVLSTGKVVKRPISPRTTPKKPPTPSNTTTPTINRSITTPTTTPVNNNNKVHTPSAVNNKSADDLTGTNISFPKSPSGRRNNKNTTPSKSAYNDSENTDKFDVNVNINNNQPSKNSNKDNERDSNDYNNDNIRRSNKKSPRNYRKPQDQTSSQLSNSNSFAQSSPNIRNNNKDKIFVYTPPPSTEKTSNTTTTPTNQPSSAKRNKNTSLSTTPSRDTPILPPLKNSPYSSTRSPRNHSTTELTEPIKAEKEEVKDTEGEASRNNSEEKQNLRDNDDTSATNLLEENLPFGKITYKRINAWGTPVKQGA
ncbi:hypothetical protein M9Y10_033429 [Tritrichomonas musculus]|uniref:Uncharacterized protein n=1 Tax=Tritrichomonas musculus TaxID=1915356 RepID=A0ABR2KFC0_9EUKA